MSKNEKIEQYINSSNTSGLIQRMFTEQSGVPLLRRGYYSERVLWDFKGNIPDFGKAHQLAWARIAKHVLAFHNSKGGVLIFGINDSDFKFSGATNYCDSARFNAAIRTYIGDLFHVVFSREFIQKDQSYLGIAIVPQKGTRIARFAGDSPKDKNGKKLFSQGDIAIRQGDTSQIYKNSDADQYISSLSLPSTRRGFYVDDENYRILAPEYKTFIYRERLCNQIMEGLNHPRVAVTSLIGIGGVGKTALATWGVIECYKNKQFDFIASVTSKDRELTARGVLPLEKPLTTYEELLDAIFRVLGFPEALNYPILQKEELVKSLLSDANGLLYIDNLETIDDPKIITFLDNLPLGVRAIVTSRVDRVRVSAFPIHVSTLDANEIVQFVDSMTFDPKLSYLADFTRDEMITFGSHCNGIPLAMRWIASKCKNPREAMSTAREIQQQSATSEELLEFSFRRIFENLDIEEKKLLKILSIYHNPLPVEELQVCSNLSYQSTGDILAGLEGSSLVEKNYDEALSDNVYTLLPITRTFVYGEVRNDTDFETKVRKRMQMWLDASDIDDPTRRSIARAMRQSKISNEERLLQFAESAKNDGKIIDAENLYNEAIKRNERSWQAHYEYARFLREASQDIRETIYHYRMATVYAPKSDKRRRALLFREYGIVVRKSGNANGLQDAIKALTESKEMNPHDLTTIHVLADSHYKLKHYTVAVKLLEPVKGKGSIKDKELILTTLQLCYRDLDDVLKSALVSRELEEIRRN